MGSMTPVPTRLEGSYEMRNEMVANTCGRFSRLFCEHDLAPRRTNAVATLLDIESRGGLTVMDYWRGFKPLADSIKNDFLAFLLHYKHNGKRVLGYWAPANGDTLLNYTEVKPDLLPFVVYASPHQQGLFLPGAHIPVVSEASIQALKPDFVEVSPWNLRQEITEQLDDLREWGRKFVAAIPAMVVS